MVRVEEELNRERADLLGEADELAQRIETIGKKVSAIDRVIAIYDPAHAALTALRTDRKRSRREVQLPIHLVQLNKIAAILEVLREAGEPLSQPTAQAGSLQSTGSRLITRPFHGS